MGVRPGELHNKDVASSPVEESARIVKTHGGQSIFGDIAGTETEVTTTQQWIEKRQAYLLKSDYSHRSERNKGSTYMSPLVFSVVH